jgi:methylated-DNA-[protein]-cysteine S-methyltransferase
MIILTMNYGLATTMAVTHTTITSGLGDLTVVGRDGVMVGLYFPHHWYMPDRAGFGERCDVGFEDVGDQLGDYLAGERRGFDVAVGTHGDERQERVWDLVGQIPYGETATYGELARRLGDGTTPQEVGAAVGHNPVCILVPCHRVVGANGKFCGYAGGLRRKRFLLDLERDVVGRASRLF